ncbi:MAG TPA: hypothetical protein VGL03_11175 [Thermoanaerobaculia bacterium]|jgi:hypothetical protein
MKQRFGFFYAACAAAAMIFVGAGAARAQVTPAEGYTPPDDTPSVKVGGTIFANYTWVAEPRTTDSDGNLVHSNAFDVTRAYINVTGNISHLVSFRITPDVVRTGSVTLAPGTTADVPGLTGTLTYRLKYAYGQLNLDDWTTKGSWFRLGMQQTPIVDYEEGIYRYRFQGTIFVEREGFLTSSDLGASVHWVFPQNYGDIHVGVYNGEGYTRPEQNDQKAFQIRASVRPAPMIPILKGLRLTGFYDGDHYVQDAKKERFIGQLTFEHPFVNVGVDYLRATDQNASATRPEVKAEGFSVWATPRTPFGLELLLRFDRIKPNKDADPARQRLIGGVAYWFPVQKGVSAAVLLDYEDIRSFHFSPARARDERYALHTLFNF